VTTLDPMRCIAGVLGVIFAFAAVACGPAPLLSPLRASDAVVRPDGSGGLSPFTAQYDLGRRADVEVLLVAASGESMVLRERATRAPDTYAVRFDGTVPTGLGRRVVGDGDYRIRVTAIDESGARSVEEALVTVREGNRTPVEIVQLQTDLTSFSPNGDGVDDELRITYGLSKEGESTVYAIDAHGQYHAIDPWRSRRATLQSHLWDGTTGGRMYGGKLLPDGPTIIHVEARDLAGNASHASVPVTIQDGGTPRLQIVDVRFSPIAVILGGTIDVRITVRNTGTTAIRSWGPAPGHTYSAPFESFATIRADGDESKPAFFERRGVWRVGVTWQNAPQAYPLRWGLFPPVPKADGTLEWDSRVLRPGETATVDGHIRVMIREDSRQVRFSAGLVQEGVGFPAGMIGEQVIQVGW